MTPLEKFKAERDELARDSNGLNADDTETSFNKRCFDDAGKFIEGYNAALKSSAVRELVEALDENKKASELGYQVYPLEENILKALANFNEILKGIE